jgi:hypothetical protein
MNPKLFLLLAYLTDSRRKSLPGDEWVFEREVEGVRAHQGLQ